MFDNLKKKINGWDQTEMNIKFVKCERCRLG